MKKIAVDIVLLPPKKITDLCIKVNRQDPKRNLTLDKTNHLPHITVLMGVIEKSNIKIVNKILKHIISDFSPINIELIGFSCTMNGVIKICVIDTKVSTQLLNLQKQVLHEMKPYLIKGKIDKTMFYDKDISAGSLNWVKAFPKAELGRNYKPHITLHTTNPKYDKLPIKFTASKIALCHLGHFCTCRKILK